MYVLRVDEILDGYVCCTGWLKSELEAWRRGEIEIEDEYVNIPVSDLLIEHYLGDDGSVLEPFLPASGDLLEVQEDNGRFRGTITRHVITETECAKLIELVSKLKEEIKDLNERRLL